MAIVKACLSSNSNSNTGKECDISMGATAMLLAVPKSISVSDTDFEDPIAWITPLLHAPIGQRVYPFFGTNAPIRAINNTGGDDVTVTLDDGSIIFVRYAIYNRIFETTSGGLCYAKTLKSLGSSGYDIMEIDQEGQMLVHKNSDGTYKGIIPDFMHAPSPLLADFKNPYKNRFQLSFNPSEMVENGEILKGAGALLSLMGLIDVKLTQAAVPTTTTITLHVITHCAEADLIALLDTALVAAGTWIVTDKATGAVVTTTATIVGGNLVLTGTFVTGHTYHVRGANPDVWYAATLSIEGYDASGSGIDVLIP